MIGATRGDPMHAITLIIALVADDAIAALMGRAALRRCRTTCGCTT
jgi:hypothetical protein